MKRLFLSAIVMVFAFSLFGQKHFTKDGHISFYSEAPLEKIEAHNKRVTAVLDSESGVIEFALLIKSFQFEKALMQEHFNENYMESSKFPKAVFKGTITNLEDIDWTAPGKYNANVAGSMTIHGVTKETETTGVFTVTEEGINGQSTFVLLCADYEIKIPKVVADNIAKEIEVTVDVNLQPLK